MFGFNLYNHLRSKVFLCSLLVPVAIILHVSAQPIRVHQPTAVTSPPAPQLSPQQIDYLLKHYIASEADTPRIVLTPPHHDYVPIDSAYIRSTNPKLLRSIPTVAVAATATSITKLEGGLENGAVASQYFLPTARPTFATEAVAVNPSGFDFYFPQADEDVRNDGGNGADATGVRGDLAYLRNLQPPVQPEDDEPNYYAALKLNTANKRAPPKKFNSTRKQVHLKTSSTTTAAADNSGNGSNPKATVSKLLQRQHEFRVKHAQPEAVYVGQETQQDTVTQQPERRTPKTAIRTLREEELNTGEYLPSILRNGNADGQRIAYQMHGFSGPQSYRFGYDTGKG